MLEYIERESLVKDIKHYSHARIDNDAIDQMGFQFVEEIVSILRIIEKQPTADVVEVVICKDCELYKAYSDPLKGFYGQCLVRECDIGENDFCSYGIKKEGAEE